MKIAVIGQGGHSKVVKDILMANHDEIIGYFDDKFHEAFTNNEILYGPIHSVYNIIETNKDVKIIIAIGNNRTRKLVTERLELPVERYGVAVHPSAIISPSTQIGFGTVIMPNAVLNADASIEHHAIINTGAVIEHDNHIASFAHISPQVTLTGGVEICEGAHIGAGATIIPNIRVGEWSIIGAGATVVKHIPAHSTAMGTPARIKKLRI
ncbi:acetyltransferase [Mesobacillus foraminis]|uniref:acetyltransferase n=1 Tax=Mesobacillus foraminis TaxID=279826 RepID=UPI000EF50C8A|nr:acetyltransferase [Mesobacillus foraminis]